MSEPAVVTQESDAMAAAELPAGAMVVRPAQPLMELESPEAVREMIRRRDEQQLLGLIMGQVTDKWFYEFEVKGKLIEGVSVVGAAEFARIAGEFGYPIRYAPYGISTIEITYRGELGVQSTVIRRNYRTGAEGSGQAFYPWYVERKRKDGSIERVLDDKADRKALAVADRNAILDLIPEATIVAVLRERKRLAAANQDRQAAAADAAVASFTGAAPESRRLASGAPGSDPACPKCGSAMSNNAAKNRERAAEGKKPMPLWKCKDQSCEGLIWGDRKSDALKNGSGAKAKKEADAAPTAAPHECPGCGHAITKSSDHHIECRFYAD